MPPILPPIEQEKLLHVGIWPHTAGGDWCGEWQAVDGKAPAGGDPGVGGADEQ